MRTEVERNLILRGNNGERFYYDCPKCIQKDPTGSLVISWSQETFICNHCDSCGFRGHISELAKEFNINVPRQSNMNYQKPIKKQYNLKQINPITVKIDEKQATQVDVIQRMQQMEALFDHSAQLVVCIDSNYGALISGNLQGLEYSEDNYSHFKVNAGGSKAADIKEYKYTLVECDDIADMSIQRGYITGLGLPVASLVWSGNKSLHAVIKVDAPTHEEYKRRVSLIHEVCDGVGFKIDKTKDCCRFTRLAGGVNTKTGKLQQLISLNFGALDWNDWEINHVPKFVVTQNVINSANIKTKRIESGFSSGFLTFDYNDSGLKDCTLCLLTGKRGQGKTTFARQLLIASAKQNKKCFAWFGEGDKEIEKGYLVRLLANKDELIPYDNGYGRTLWAANESAEQRYNESIGNLIDMYVKPPRLEVPVFEDLMSRMTDKVRLGCKFFLVDNMMKLTVDQHDTFKAQQQIITRLKEFADNHQVYICIICHPRAGDGDQKISGAQEQENTADTILRFKRVFALTDAQTNEQFPSGELRNVTALVTCEKVRNGGKEHTMFMEFDGVKQANREIVYLDDIADSAEDYDKCGYYSRKANFQGIGYE